jgi:hypothetical protein
VVKEGGNVRWEEGANHKRTLPAAGASSTLQDSWHEKHMGH